MSRVRDVNGVNSALISQRVYLVIFGVIATQVVAARGAYGVVTRRLDTHVNIFADSALSRGTVPARSVHRLSGLGQPASAWVHPCILCMTGKKSDRTTEGKDLPL